MHCSKANHPDRAQQDYRNGRNTAKEEVIGSQQCLKGKTEPGVQSWHPDFTALSENFLHFSFDFTFFKSWKMEMIRHIAGNFPPEKAGLTLLVLFHQLLLSAPCHFLVFFPLARLYFINLSQHQEGNNKTKKLL